MTPDILLSVLKDFGEEDFKDFKWHLQKEKLKGHPAIPKNKLEKAERRDTVDLMIQTFTLPGAVEVTKQLLKKINRNDLVQHLCDSGPGVCNSADGPSSSQPPHLPTDRKDDGKASEVSVCNSADGPSSSQPPHLPTNRKTDGKASEDSALNSNSLLRELDLSKDPDWGLDMPRVEHDGEQRLKPGLRKYACELTLDTNSVNTSSQVSCNKRKLTVNQSSSNFYDSWSKWLRRK